MKNVASESCNTHLGPILERKGMRAVFSEKGQKRQNI